MSSHAPLTRTLAKNFQRKWDSNGWVAQRATWHWNRSGGNNKLIQLIRYIDF